MNAPQAIFGAHAVDEAYFNELAAALDRSLQPGEFYTATLAAERSDFVRFNRGKVRQPGCVSQAYLEVDLIAGRRHAVERLTLSGDLPRDTEAIGRAVAALRGALPALADDPHLLYATDVRSTRSVQHSKLPSIGAVVEDVVGLAKEHDLVAFYAGGPVMRGFANAQGQRNWHEVASCALQWSLYHRGDKAVKSAISGLAWDPALLHSRMHEAETQLSFVAQPSRSLPPGDYRAYLAPAAMEELIGLLQWGGFSARAHATHQSSLSRMTGEQALALHDRVSLREATAEGLAPAFQGAGFIRPAEVRLVDQGRLVGTLASPRTAREFGMPSNGANGDEIAESLVMAGGNLDAGQALAALDRGLYVGNLWYLNYSDRPACRITGMTRFATFWVEEGRIVAPVDVLRFDDTIYSMLGEQLEALTRETELRLDSSTYLQRSLSSMRLPGALLSRMTFTL